MSFRTTHLPFLSAAISEWPWEEVQLALMQDRLELAVTDAVTEVVFFAQVHVHEDMNGDGAGELAEGRRRLAKNKIMNLLSLPLLYGRWPTSSVQ